MPEPGDLIGPYRLVSQLGQGAMGQVWRARDERLDRYVALKVLPPDHAGDVERRTRMLREARAAAAIRHGNVVTLFDVVEHGGEDILVMELVEGRTLADVLRTGGPPSLEQALRWIEAIADALAAAHARRVLHRDIKAANIMIASDGGVKVLDFGLAKRRDDELSAATTAPAMPRAPSGLEATVHGYETHSGTLLGTPLYMAPEQVRGGTADERSEVFSVGVLAHEILAGRPPYTASSLTELFEQIANAPIPPLPRVPESVAAVVARALAKEPAARWSSMTALRDAVAAQRRRLFAPAAKRWPLLALAAFVVLASGAGVWWWLADRAPPPRPGDDYVQRALDEYDVFYQEKALSSLRAALAVAPEHPRANAYMILFGGASDADRAAAFAAAQRARPVPAVHTKDRALLDAAIALVEQGPIAAHDALLAARAAPDRELAFWTAELDFRAGRYETARDEYRALLAQPVEQFRGRIYDHHSAVLLYLDEPAEALRIGKLYRDAFPGEPDAVAVYATTLAAAGRSDEAVAAAEDALRLSEGEDTLAGLAKVLALRGERSRARELYQRSLDKAGPARRPLRRAALAFLEWIDGDLDAANATVAPCLPGGADAAVRERGPCLFVAGVIDPAHADVAAAALDALAAEATAGRPAYGAPASLARLVRTRARFFGGACIIDAARQGPAPAQVVVDEAAYAAPLDFYAAYHVPYFATWAVCEHAALLAHRGERREAAALLAPIAARAPGRQWLVATLRAYESAVIPSPR
jgi:hypothetical protein